MVHQIGYLGFFNGFSYVFKNIIHTDAAAQYNGVGVEVSEALQEKEVQCRGYKDYRGQQVNSFVQLFIVGDLFKKPAHEGEFKRVTNIGRPVIGIVDYEKMKKVAPFNYIIQQQE
ncbi:MAG: hypothetical protein PHD73_11485 [Sediminibacterium sp.]|nr:hypothetical protein [Sediminibacterium sp.]